MHLERRGASRFGRELTSLLRCPDELALERWTASRLVSRREAMPSVSAKFRSVRTGGAIREPAHVVFVASRDIS